MPLEAVVVVVVAVAEFATNFAGPLALILPSAPSEPTYLEFVRVWRVDIEILTGGRLSG